MTGGDDQGKVAGTPAAQMLPGPCGELEGFVMLQHSTGTWQLKIQIIRN